MASYWPFGHLQPKLWAKEGPGVKLAVWLPTTKSRESTSSRPPNRECDTSLERSRRRLQVWLRPHRDRTPQSGVMSSQSPRTLPGTISRQFRDSNPGVPGVPGKSDTRAWVPPRVAKYTIGSMVMAYSRGPGRGVSRGPKCPWLVPTPKGVPNAKLTSCGWFLDADSSLIY
jgi:hypothetical protein